ncbi:MAG: hypothetical protein HYX68_09350 [Planctomycetes bacterium]|nr:hypothetical protein [Planctomycetota bacterium]
MNLRAQFERTWRAGYDYDALLTLVHEQQERLGNNATESDAILQQRWLDNGFNDSADANPLQDKLEYVMEKLWYEQPAIK